MEYDHRQGGHRFGFIHKLPSMFGNGTESAIIPSETAKSLPVTSYSHKAENSMVLGKRTEACSQFPFMSLPIEVRLQIYQNVYEMTPINSITESMPWYPVPSLRPYPTQEIRPPVSPAEDERHSRRYSQGTTHSIDDSDYSLPPLSAISTGSSTNDSLFDTFSHTSPLHRKSSSSSWSSYNNNNEPSSPTTKFDQHHHHLNNNSNNNKDPAPLLPPSRPYAKLPTSLLQTSSTIYHESRLIPFYSNEFVFPTWFASGVHSAGALTQKLVSWQISAMRWTRLEILSRDLETVPLGRGSRLSPYVDACDVSGSGHGDGQEGEDGGEKEMVHMTDFLRLCSAWSDGLRGLRIKIMAAERVWFGAPWDTASGFGMMDFGYAANGPIPAPGEEGGAQGGGSGDAVSEGPKGIITVRDDKGRVRPWVSKGLAMMKGMRQLEVELCPTAPLVTAAAASAMAEVGNEDAPGLEQEEKATAEAKAAMQKVRWCADLEDAINETRAEGKEKVSVVCVSKVLFAK